MHCNPDKLYLRKIRNESTYIMLAMENTVSIGFQLIYYSQTHESRDRYRYTDASSISCTEETLELHVYHAARNTAK